MAFTVNSSRIASNTIALYIRMGITMIISFFTARVTLQQLGVDDYGLNNLVGSIVSMLSFLNSSMGTAVQRFYSIEIGKNNEKRLGRVYGVALYLHIIVAAITFLLAEIFAVFFLHKMSIPADRMHAAQVVFQISVVSLILNIITVPNAAILRSREMFSKTAVVEIIQAMLRLVVLYLLVHVAYDKLITLSLLNFAITIYYVGALFFMSRKFSETHNLPLRDKELIRQMLSFISLLVVTIMTYVAKTQGIALLVNLFFGLVINAAYAIAIQVSNIVESFANNFKTSMEPQMVSAYGAGDLNAMHKIINLGTKVTFLLMLAIAIPVIFESQFILNIWLGTPPEHAAKLVSLTLIAITISGFTFFQYKGVHATGKILPQQMLASSTNILSFFLFYILFKLGASFESALYVNMLIGAFQCGVNIYYSRKNYNYSVRTFFNSVLFPCIALVIITILVLSIVIYLINPSLWRFVTVFVLSEMMILLLGYNIVLDKNEKEKTKEMTKAIFDRIKVIR